jgi:hypothetical protein
MGIYSHSGDSYSSTNAEEIKIYAERERKVMASYVFAPHNLKIALHRFCEMKGSLLKM